MTGEPPHGDRRRFLHGCHCDPCRRANATYCKTWRLRSASDPASTGVPVTVVAEHVARLLRTMSAEAIAAAAGVSRATVRRVATQRKVRPSTATALLTVHPATSTGRHQVSALGSRRRVEALMALGWTPAEVGRAVGLTRQNFMAIASGRRAIVSAGTAQRIREVYDRLSMLLAPPGSTRTMRAHRTRMRRLAAAHGWAPPLAWDDEDLDDPTATSHPTGHRAEHLDLDEFMFLVDAGEPAGRAAARCGISVSGVTKAARRHLRDDVLAALADARAAEGRATA